MSQVLPSAQPVNHQQNNPTDNMSNSNNVANEFNQNTAINVDASEVEKFNNLASEWWNKTGAFATLHEINPLRLNWIEDNVKRGFMSADSSKTAEMGLAGKKFLMSAAAAVSCQNLWRDAALMLLVLTLAQKISKRRPCMLSKAI